MSSLYRLNTGPFLCYNVSCQRRTKASGQAAWCFSFTHRIPEKEEAHERKPETDHSLQLQSYAGGGRDDSKKMELAGIKNQSAFIRRIVLGGLILRLDLPELTIAVRLMGSMSNNVNQIARRLHEGGAIYETEVDEIVERQKQLQDTLDKFSPAWIG